MNENDKWSKIKKGDTLFSIEQILGRDAFTHNKFILPVWKKHTVESTTKAFYFVDGVKHRKDALGSVTFGKSFVFSGDTHLGFVAPTESTPPNVIDAFAKDLKTIKNATMVCPKIAQLDDMALAVEYSNRFISLNAELSEHINRQK